MQLQSIAKKKKQVLDLLLIDQKHQATIKWLPYQDCSVDKSRIVTYAEYYGRAQSQVLVQKSPEEMWSLLECEFGSVYTREEFEKDKLIKVVPKEMLEQVRSQQNKLEKYCRDFAAHLQEFSPKQKVLFIPPISLWDEYVNERVVRANDEYLLGKNEQITQYLQAAGFLLSDQVATVTRQGDPAAEHYHIDVFQNKALFSAGLQGQVCQDHPLKMVVYPASRGSGDPILEGVPLQCEIYADEKSATIPKAEGQQRFNFLIIVGGVIPDIEMKERGHYYFHKTTLPASSSPW